MANKDASFGLRPARMMNGSAFMNQQNRIALPLATQHSYLSGRHC